MSDRFRIGEAVYAYSKPLRYGKVIGRREVAVSYSPDPDIYMLVRWKDGTETEEWDLQLKSLEQLAKDCERKASTHKKNIQEAWKL